MHGDAHIETLERLTFGGALRSPFTAHPKKDPATGACICLPLHKQHASKLAQIHGSVYTLTSRNPVPVRVHVQPHL